MIQFILGQKGTGKTKFLIDRINDAVKQSVGHVAVIEKGNVLRYDVDHAARLIDIEDYGVKDFNAFYGFLAGLCAGDYDLTDIFVDATFKIGGRDYAAFAEMAHRAEKLSEDRSSNICFTVSCDMEDLPEDVRGFVINN